MASIPTSRKESKFPKTIYDLIPDGDYDARIVRFIGLGVQEQPPYEGQEKEPAFKCSIVYELFPFNLSSSKSNIFPLVLNLPKKLKYTFNISEHSSVKP